MASANCVEYMLGIKAADRLAATVVPIYDTLGADATAYISNHAGEALLGWDLGSLDPHHASCPPCCCRPSRTPPS